MRAPVSHWKEMRIKKGINRSKNNSSSSDIEMFLLNCWLYKRTHFLLIIYSFAHSYDCIFVQPLYLLYAHFNWFVYAVLFSIEHIHMCGVLCKRISHSKWLAIVIFRHIMQLICYKINWMAYTNIAYSFVFVHFIFYCQFYFTGIAEASITRTRRNNDRISSCIEANIDTTTKWSCYGYR